MAAKKPAPPKSPPTLDEQIAAAIERERYHEAFAVQGLPVPRRVLRVGQEVHLGRLSDAVIVAVLNEGRRVAVQHTAATLRTDDRSTEKVVRIVPAHEVQVKGTEAADDFGTMEHHMLSYSNRDVSGLLGMVSMFGVDMDPDYQRGLVWGAEDKERLIDSIFNQVDIGKFVFRRLPFQSGKPGYEIVDGKQRLNALVEFVSDGFPCRGRYWSELSQFDRNFLEAHPIAYAELQEGLTRPQVLQTFLRLNTGGRPMDPAHLQKVAEMAQAEQPRRASGPKP